MNESRTEALHVRISPAAKTKLMERAAREKRKLAALMAIILEEAAESGASDTPKSTKAKA